jgi:hypothetical protein
VKNLGSSWHLASTLNANGHEEPKFFTTKKVKLGLLFCENLSYNSNSHGKARKKKKKGVVNNLVSTQ